MKYIGYITTTILLSIVCMTANAWGLTKLWSWFMVKIFDLPSISIPAALGIVITYNFDIFPSKDNQKEFDFWADVCNSLIILFIKITVLLGIGWIVKGLL